MVHFKANQTFVSRYLTTNKQRHVFLTINQALFILKLPQMFITQYIYFNNHNVWSESYLFCSYLVTNHLKLLPYFSVDETGGQNFHWFHLNHCLGTSCK